MVTVTNPEIELSEIAFFVNRSEVPIPQAQNVIQALA